MKLFSEASMSLVGYEQPTESKSIDEVSKSPSLSDTPGVWSMCTEVQEKFRKMTLLYSNIASQDRDDFHEVVIPAHSFSLRGKQ